MGQRLYIRLYFMFLGAGRQDRQGLCDGPYCVGTWDEAGSHRSLNCPLLLLPL